MDTFDKLTELVKKGYLLHGSRKKLSILLPNKKDKIHKNVGRYKAVYATDNPAIALFFATSHGDKLPKINGKTKNLKGIGFTQNQQPIFYYTPNYFKNKGFGPGYVYILGKSNFKKLKKIPYEYYSFKKVTPTKIIKVASSDFKKNCKIKNYPVKLVKEAGFHTEEEIIAMGYHSSSVAATD